MDKLQQANQLQHQINQLEKQIDLYNKVQDSFANTALKEPKIGIQVNPSFPSNAVYFDLAYVPVKVKDVIAAYIKNMEDHKTILTAELNNLFN